MLLQSRACTAQHRLKKILSVSHRLQFPKFTSSVTVHASSMGDAVMDGSADAWNAAARGYEQLGAARSSTGLKVAGLKAGDSLLDVGTGPGDLAIVAAEEFKAQVSAVDLSPGMIKILVDRLADSTTSVTAKVMDGQNLDLADSSFDVVHSSFGVTLFPDFRKGLKEMVRVTRPGGSVVVVGPKAGCGTYAPWMKLMCGGRFPDAEPVPKPVASKFMGTEEGICNELTAAGLENVEVSEERNEVRVSDVAALVEGSLSNPFMQDVQKKLSPERWEELQQALRDMLAESKLDDGTTGYYITSLIACGKKPSQ